MECKRCESKMVECSQYDSFLCEVCGFRSYDWYKDDMEILTKALLKAKAAFDSYINDEEGLDGIYFGMDVEGTLYDVELNPMHKITIKFDIPFDESGEAACTCRGRV